MYRAQEVDDTQAPRLVGMVQQLAHQARLPMPRVYIVPNQTPNAFATGRNPEHAAVAATEGLLNLLDDEELAGVMAHELAHIKHRDILISSVVATVAGAISALASMIKWGLIFGVNRNGRDQGSNLGTLAMAIVAPLIALLLQMAISRSREFAADAEGARIAHNPLGLARALRKISQGVERAPMDASPAHQASAHLFIASPFRGRDMLALLSTHPKVEERIERLEQMARGER
ncbi:protease HtpX homolog [Ylistrum balloti]|uniref:protease HtpX homolog n=1 Tax=Ylistrum balloti TaxID=509963 RepID=UPI002905BACF|nr:protease HtpX homolog [Ylistrum balloti]